MRLKDWPIWLKLIALLLVPVLSAIGLWLYALNTTISNSQQFSALQNIYQGLALQDIKLVSALETEQANTAYYVGSGHTLGNQEMLNARQATDQLIQQWNASVSNTASTPKYNDMLRHDIDLANRALATVNGLRANVTNGTPLAQVVTDYSTTSDSLNQSILDAVPLFTDPQFVVKLEAVGSLERTTISFTAESCFLSGVMAQGKFTDGQFAQFSQFNGAWLTRLALADTQIGNVFPPDQVVGKDPTIVAFNNLAQSVLARGEDGEKVPVTQAQWTAVSQKAGERVYNAILGLSQTTVGRVVDIGHNLDNQVWLAVILGVVAILLSLIISLWLARLLARKLARLRRGALELASEKLPAVVERLQQGERVDVAAEVPPITGLGRDEIGQVGDALNAARTTAVAVAVQQAALRHGVSQMFLNLARRSQALVHRQIKLIDAMERREVDPDELRDLFQLDHLATRMRRHAEDLIVLSGSAPGRGWRNPVPLGDVVRGAVAEVENYAHATVLDTPDVAIAGPAVGDVMHLLAELIENATSFSPPDAPVNISSHLVANGAAVEIEDGGLGITEEDLVVLNDRLANPPPFDPTNSERLGLFVVSRLAVRHGIQVRLRRSVYGGTTAIVLIPTALLHGPDHAPLGGQPEGERVEAGVVDPDMREAEEHEMSWRGWFNETQRSLGITPTPSVPVRSILRPAPTAPTTPTVDAPSVVGQPSHRVVPRQAAGEREPWNSRTARLTRDTADAAEPDEEYVGSRRRPPGPDESADGPATGNWGTRRPDVRDARSRVPETAPTRTEPRTEPGGMGSGGGGMASGGRGTGGMASGGMASGGMGSGGVGGDRGAARGYGVGDDQGEADLRSRPTTITPTYTEVGLPRRVRQANLAPQLRGTQGTGADLPDEEPTTRHPEQIRSMMSSYQNGYRRGRTALPPVDNSSSGPAADREDPQPPHAAQRGRFLLDDDDPVPSQPHSGAGTGVTEDRDDPYR